MGPAKQGALRLCLVSAMVLAPGAGVPLAHAAGRVLCALEDGRIDESSGLAASPTRDVMYTHNDSGGGARFFVVDPNCRTSTVVRMLGAEARDWEDMAAGLDERGAPSLYFADIGDNSLRRDTVTIYRAPEPAVGATMSGRVVRFTFRYPDGPHDAEALLVHPRTGEIAIVTKAPGLSGIYVPASRPQASGVTTLRRAAEFVVAPTGTPGGPAGLVGQLTVTGGAVSPAGDRLVLRTYTDAYEWRVTGRLEDAFVTAPVRIAMESTRQGEAITYTRDGRRLVTTTEGRRTPVHTYDAATATLLAAAPRQLPAVPDMPAPNAQREPEARTEQTRVGPGAVAGAAGLVLVVAAVAVAMRHRRRSLE